MRIGIVGYGNLGRAAERAAAQAQGIELTAIFTRRDPAAVEPAGKTRVLPLQDILAYREEIDVLLLCGGSATDLPRMTPALAREFHCVDSFDTHAHISEHFDAVDRAARDGGRLALVSAGWDPGLFSMMRLLFSAVLPQGTSYTFWGRGVSQGHSQAVRQIPGVLDARQYTIPAQEALEDVRRGNTPALSERKMHKRECFVAVEQRADRQAVERAIMTMPDYFAGYDTTVQFVTLEELRQNHGGLPHAGSVIRNGVTGDANRHTLELSLRLDSNPEFTSGVLLACARAVWRLAQRGETGCRTLLDVPLSLLSPLSPREQRASLL